MNTHMKPTTRQPTARIKKIVETLNSLGGCARIREIFQEHKRLFPEATSTATWEAGLRNALQRHNPDSSQYQKGNPHLFGSPARGVWALRSSALQLRDEAADLEIAA
jgi:hypothetical protein